MTDIAIYQASVPDRMRYAEALSGSSLLPRDYVGKPANVLLAIEYGAALGIPPMTAIQGVHVIQGRPTASAGLIGALVRKAGHRLRVTGDDRRAECVIVRADDPDFEFRSVWTIERAQQAKLTGKDTWKAFPAAMLKARAITECARDACPEALAGVQYTAEELGADAAPAAHEAVVERLDAVPVDDAFYETTGAVSAPTADASAEPSAAPAPVPDPGVAAGAGEGPAATPAEPRRDGWWVALQKGLTDRFDRDRATALAWVSLQVGREVTSTKELDNREVQDVVAILQGRRVEVVEVEPPEYDPEAVA